MFIRKLYLALLLLLIGFILGWLSKTWLTLDHYSPESARIELSEPSGSNTKQAHTLDTPTAEPDQIVKDSSNTIPSTVLTRFKQSLNERLYQDAMLIYHHQAQISEQTLAILKEALLSHLQGLLETHNQNDFSALTGLFLSTYYDDIDILLLLAKFNYANHAYLEAINVFQQAQTYAYTQIKQQNVQKQFIDFANAIDQLYTEAQDWFALSNFYTQIEAAGLLTSWQQYRQAIALFHSGNQTTAITKLKQLQNDAQIRAQATTALNELSGSPKDSDIPITPLWQNAQAIPIQQSGNHYLIRVNLNDNDNVTLLIDTGASMTTLTRQAFNSLSSISQTTDAGVRVFQTANGTTTGALYNIPQINIGPYQMHNIQIAVLDFPASQDIDGLLGMNILGRYRFQIDQENARLLLSEKETLHER